MLGTPLGQGFFQADRPEQRQATDSLNISTTSIRERQQSGVPSMFAFWSRREYGYTGVEGDLILQAGTEASMLGGYTREPNTTALRLCFLPRPEVSKTGVLITFFSERRLLAEPRIPPILTPFSVVESVLSRKLARYERRLEYSFAIADGELAMQWSADLFECVSPYRDFHDEVDLWELGLLPHHYGTVGWSSEPLHPSLRFPGLNRHHVTKRFILFHSYSDLAGEPLMQNF